MCSKVCLAFPFVESGDEDTRVTVSLPHGAIRPSDPTVRSRATRRRGESSPSLSQLSAAVCGVGRGSQVSSSSVSLAVPPPRRAFMQRGGDGWTLRYHCPYSVRSLWGGRRHFPALGSLPAPCGARGRGEV
jgi:hypothetical protein